jgi:hypothetical protein
VAQTVDLDNQLCGGAVEVDNEPPDGVLATKFETAGPGSHLTPK